LAVGHVRSGAVRKALTLRGGLEQPSSMGHERLIEVTKEWVKKEIEACDASHDWTHVQRVHKSAMKIAEKEGAGSDDKAELLVIELAALMHDVRDYKYSGSDSEGVEAGKAFLAREGVDAALIDRVMHVIENVSFSKELARGLPPKGSPPAPVKREVGCVQDADRLDAIGAVGIARCLTFGGARKRPLYDETVAPRAGLTAEAYRQGSGTTLNHFYEKLLLLAPLMKTATGRQMAEERHAFMEQFLSQFHAEVSA